MNSKLKKLLIYVLSVLLITVCPFCALADEVDFELKLGKEYTVARSEEALGELSRIIGMKEAELREYFEQNDLLLLAANEDNSSQVRLSVSDNDFAELIGNLTGLGDGEIEEVAKELTAETQSYTVKENNGDKFIVITETLRDSGGVYTATQFCTVKSGVMYQLSFYNAGDKTADSVYTAFESFKITPPEDTAFPPWVTVSAVFGIAVFTAIAVVLIIDVVKDIKKRRSKQNSDEPESTIF